MLTALNLPLRVALRKESVDRKLTVAECNIMLTVALRKESVDRKVDGAVSGSADYVALRKESVDRKAVDSPRRAVYCSRSPQGERG